MIHRTVTWMWAHKASAVAIAAGFVTAWLAGYGPLVGDRREELDRRRNEIDKQKEAFIEKKRLAINADAYRQQVASLPRCDLATNGGSAAEDGRVYDRVAHLAAEHGIRVMSLRVSEGRTMTEFFAHESPADLRLAGDYHRFGRFFQAMSGLPSYATVDAMRIERSEGEALILTTRMKLTRLTTEEEQRAWSKANAPKKKAGKK
jgi:type IV pilus assembly protein PilO